MSVVIILFAMIGYALSVHSVFMGNPTSVLSWMSWVILDALVLFPSRQRGDDITTLLVYTMGSLCVALYSLIKIKKILWGNIEKFSIVLTLVSFTVSKLISDYLSIICATICMTVSGAPLLYHIYKTKSQSMREVIAVMSFFICSVFGVYVAITSSSSLVFPVSSFGYSLVWILLSVTFYKKST